MTARTLAKVYGHFAAALGTCMLVILPVAHLVRIPGWAYLYALPILAVAYAVLKTASESPPTLEQLYLEIARREELARRKAIEETARRHADRTATRGTGG
jgi:hypothetical protein